MRNLTEIEKSIALSYMATLYQVINPYCDSMVALYGLCDGEYKNHILNNNDPVSIDQAATVLDSIRFTPQRQK